MECFLVPVKLRSPDDEFHTRRCIGGIRTFYPISKIVLAVAKDSLPLTIQPDENMEIVENPYFATIGCLSLFHRNKYAEFAFILHDSMTVVKPIEADYTSQIQFFYFFTQPGMANDYYHSGYAEILSPEDHRDMVQNQIIGCFGATMFIRHSAIERMGILPLIPKVTRKFHLDCMERIIAYLATKHGLLKPNHSICGACMDLGQQPWNGSMTLDEMLRAKTPYSVLKVILARQ
jgi:hypothetical protein